MPVDDNFDEFEDDNVDEDLMGSDSYGYEGNENDEPVEKPDLETDTLDDAGQESTYGIGGEDNEEAEDEEDADPLYSEDEGEDEEADADEEEEVKNKPKKKSNSNQSIYDQSSAGGTLYDVMNLGEGSYTLNVQTIQLNDVVIPEPIKNSRKDTMLGLTQSVAELGILVPIEVMISEGYADYIVEHGNGNGYEGPKYILLDGLRRVYAGLKNGIKEVKAVVWDFEDKDKGTENLNILSMILNKNQQMSWAGKWNMYQVLEENSALNPDMLEYLLQLEPGDATKLKEIMTRSKMFPEPREDLLSKKKTLQQCYNLLNKQMKEQDVLQAEDTQSLSGIESMEGVVDELADEGEDRGAEDVESGNDSENPEEEKAHKKGKLTDQEVKDILDMSDQDVDLKEDDFDEMLKPEEPETQKVGKRHPLDPALKAETMERDHYQCVCCGNGKYLPMRYKLAVLQSHHKISVANGGPDTADNIVTLCVSCHTLVHSLLWSGLKFGMSKDEFDALPDVEQTKLKNVMKIARADYEAAKRLGRTRDDIMKENKNHSTFRMPGDDMKENAKAVKALNQKRAEEDVEPEESEPVGFDDEEE